MKIFVILLYLFLAGTIAGAQKLHLNLFGGLSNYQGDLHTKQFHPAFGLGVTYEITDNISARANITFGKISGDDKKDEKNLTRNLNFSSRIIDFHIGAEYNFLNLYVKKITPYVFAGISFFNFNPYTSDPSGNKVYLQPLSTEGQGFYQDRKEYKLSQFSLPFGGGFKYAINDNIRIGFEIGMRKTFTDYLDDVSSTYVDQTTLFNNRGQQAVELAFRSDEINPALTYPADGATRGEIKNKDWYYFSGLTISYRLGTGKSNGKSKTGCPTAF